MKKHIFIYIFIFILGAISVLAYLEIQKASTLEAMIDPQEEVEENEMKQSQEEREISFANRSGIILPIPENELYPYGKSQPVGPDYKLYLIPDEGYRPNTTQYQVSSGIANLEADECSSMNISAKSESDTKIIEIIDGQEFKKAVVYDNGMNQQWEITRYTQKLLSDQCRFIQVYRHFSYPENHYANGEVLKNNNILFDSFAKKEVARILSETKIEKPIYKSILPQNITQATQEVVEALEAKDFQKLEKLASSEGIFFGVGPSFDGGGGYYDHNIAQVDISEIPTDTEVRHRYTTDGKGEEINTTMYKYIYEYIYNRDYVSGDIEVNTTEFVSSNSVVSFIDEIGSRSYTTIWNEHPEFEMGDTQLILIFDEEDGEYKIRGILSHFWTI